MKQKNWQILRISRHRDGSRHRHYARTVGNILHINPDGEKYPCYKVVNSKGHLSHKYAFGSIEKQKEKLEADGIEVLHYKVDLKKYQWKI